MGAGRMRFAELTEPRMCVRSYFVTVCGVIASNIAYERMQYKATLGRKQNPENTTFCVHDNVGEPG